MITVIMLVVEFGELIAKIQRFHGIRLIDFIIFYRLEIYGKK